MANASRRIALLALLLAAAAPPTLAAAAAPRSPVAPRPATLPASRCYGAAARVHLRACRAANRAHAVHPPPAEAQITPNSPCAFVHAIVNLCAFGVPPAQAAGTIALVGDSHAWQWRAAVNVVAHRLRVHALESTRSSCALTTGFPTFPEPKLAECLQWNVSLAAWLAQRPDISTVFVSDHPERVRALAGQSQLDAQAAGVIAAWAALPPTVQHIVVIRDIPYVHEDTLECIERAIRRHRLAARACAVRRRVAIHSGPDLVAAHRLHSPRVQVIDLTRLLCDATFCYPVVGRVLAYRDSDHLTRAFAATAGPYLYQALRGLMAGWG